MKIEYTIPDEDFAEYKRFMDLCAYFRDVKNNLRFDSNMEFTDEIKEVGEALEGLYRVWHLYQRNQLYKEYTAVMGEGDIDLSKEDIL